MNYLEEGLLHKDLNVKQTCVHEKQYVHLEYLEIQNKSKITDQIQSKMLSRHTIESTNGKQKTI